MGRDKEIYGIAALIGIPFVFLLIQILVEFQAYPQVMSARRLSIIGKTMGFGLLTSVIVAVAGAMMAYFLWKLRIRYGYAMGMLVGLTLIPPYFHAYLWMTVLYRLFGIAAASGLLISLLVQSIYLFPLSVLLWYIHIKSGSRACYDTASLDLKVTSVDRRVTLTLGRSVVGPYICIFLLLGVTDYTIPSIFAFNTYPIELMSVYAGTWLLSYPVIVSVPFMAILYLMVKYLAGSAEKLLGGETSSAPHIPFPLNRVARVVAAVMAFLAAFGIILLVALESTPAMMWETLVRYLDEFVYTLSISLISSILILLVSFLLNYEMAVHKRHSRLIWSMMFLLIGLPGTVCGLLVNGQYQFLRQSWSGFDGVLYSILPGTQTLFLRFLPYGFLVVWTGFKHLASSEVDEVRMFSKKRLQIWRIGMRNSLDRYLFLGGVLTLVLGVSELSGMIMVTPPGVSTVSVLIYNYLHYGSSDAVAALSVLLMLMVAVMVVAAAYLVRGQRYD